MSNDEITWDDVDPKYILGSKVVIKDIPIMLNHNPDSPHIVFGDFNKAYNPTGKVVVKDGHVDLTGNNDVLNGLAQDLYHVLFVAPIEQKRLGELQRKIARKKGMLR